MFLQDTEIIQNKIYMLWISHQILTFLFSSEQVREYLYVVRANLDKLMSSSFVRSNNSVIIWKLLFSQNIFYWWYWLTNMIVICYTFLTYKLFKSLPTSLTCLSHLLTNQNYLRKVEAKKAFYLLCSVLQESFYHSSSINVIINFRH